MQYFEVKENKIVCKLCHHYCHLAEGISGFCHVEKNINSQLVNTTYGYPSALNLDPIEKKPLYHFLPQSKSLSLGTVGCNLRCPFCQNHAISQAKTSSNSKYFSPSDMLSLAQNNNAKSISYTYNEPVVFYPYARDIGVLAREVGIKNIFVSSGFESPEVLEDMKQWVDAANIDLKSFNKDYYKKTLKAGLNEVKKTLTTLSKSNIHIEITTLIIENINSSDYEISEMCKFISNEVGVTIPLHFSAFHPNYKMLETPITSLQLLKRVKEIAVKEGIQYVYLGNVANDNSTYCYHCDALLIQREGFNVLQNNLITSNKKSICPKCLTKLNGVF
jgi:pyruvate formate lyase activating enzyme